MTITLDDRGAILKRHVEYWKKYYTNQLQISSNLVRKYNLQPEPISSLFADHVEVKVSGISNIKTPFQAKVESEIYITWNQPTQMILERIREKQFPIEHFGRTGGVSQSFCANKKFSKLDNPNVMRAIVNESPMIYRTPEWEEKWKKDYLELERFLEARTYENISTLRNNPELITVGKPKTTGTGWPSPYNDRGSMARRFNEIADRIENTAREFYNDYYIAIENWPNNGSIIRVGNEFKGIRGNRSDVDVIEWRDDSSILSYQAHSSMTREVGNTPSAVVHNKALNNARWRYENIIRRVSDEYTTFAESIRDHALYLTTPPATMPGENTEHALISTDFGYVDAKARYDRDHLELANPKIALPADMTILSGIEVRSNGDRNRQLMKISGQEDTMDQYRIIAERPFAWQAKTMQLSPLVDYMKEGTGDDIQQIIVRDAIPEFVSSMVGNYMKLKGMQVIGNWHVVFVSGTLCCWNTERENECLWMTIPRGVRSITSAKRMEKDSDLPAELKIGDTYTLDVEPEVREQVMRYFSEFPFLVYFEGRPEEYYDLMVDKYWEGRLQAAQYGISEWLLEFYTLDDLQFLSQVTARSQIPRKQPNEMKDMTDRASDGAKPEPSQPDGPTPSGLENTATESQSDIIDYSDERS